MTSTSRGEGLALAAIVAGVVILLHGASANNFLAFLTGLLFVTIPLHSGFHHEILRRRFAYHQQKAR